jgi:hypothetical protein
VRSPQWKFGTKTPVWPYPLATNGLASGGQRIAYRGGRVDATEPGAYGTPEAHQSLEEHTAIFARQGFTQEEMIGLVACTLPST